MNQPDSGSARSLRLAYCKLQKSRIDFARRTLCNFYYKVLASQFMVPDLVFLIFFVRLVSNHTVCWDGYRDSDSGTEPDKGQARKDIGSKEGWLFFGSHAASHKHGPDCPRGMSITGSRFLTALFFLTALDSCPVLSYSPDSHLIPSRQGAGTAVTYRTSRTSCCHPRPVATGRIPLP